MNPPELPEQITPIESRARSIKSSAYVFALICSAFLAYQCWSHDRRGEAVSPIVWMPCLLLIGTALGVNVDPNQLAGMLGSSRHGG